MSERSKSARIRSVLGAYCQGFRAEDLDAICALYADNATVEDPIGTPKKEGSGEIRDFYAMSLQARPRLRSGGEPVIVGSFSATPLIVEIDYNGKHRTVELISVMSFDEDCRITSMTAYFDPAILDA